MITASEEHKQSKNFETQFVLSEVILKLQNQYSVQAFSSPIMVECQHDGNVRFSQDQTSKKGETLSDLLLSSSESFVFDPGGIMFVIYSSAILLSILSIFDSISIFPFDPGGIFLYQ
ncbi:hypothetical protein QL285_056658 [Trifolium repens]|nr:hypothetical protein QL285_056658 [Trifolium repens]